MANTTIIPLFVDSSTSTTPELQIRMDEVESFNKIDFPSIQNRPAKIGIVFAMLPLQTRATANFLYYTTTAARDAAYAAVKALVTQNV